MFVDSFTNLFDCHATGYMPTFGSADCATLSPPCVFSRITSATTAPERNVNAAIDPIAHAIPKMSAMMPAGSIKIWCRSAGAQTRRCPSTRFAGLRPTLLIAHIESAKGMLPTSAIGRHSCSALRARVRRARPPIGTTTYRRRCHRRSLIEQGPMKTKISPRR